MRGEDLGKKETDREVRLRGNSKREKRPHDSRIHYLHRDVVSKGISNS